MSVSAAIWNVHNGSEISNLLSTANLHNSQLQLLTPKVQTEEDIVLYILFFPVVRRFLKSLIVTSVYIYKVQ
jgi:hypothetical protein